MNAREKSVCRCFCMVELIDTVPYAVEAYIYPPYPNSQGAVYTHVHLPVIRRKLAIFKNVWVQTYNVHIVNLLPFLAYVICLGSFCSTPVQGIPNIYCGVNIGLRAKFIFKARIFVQQFCKLAPSDRNNLITSVVDFLHPRFSFLIPVLQSFLSLTNVLMSIWHAKTPIPKHPSYSKRLVSAQYPLTFTLGAPAKWTFVPLLAWVTLLRVRPIYASNWRASTDWRSPIW